MEKTKDPQTTLKVLLQNEFSKRCRANSRYSLRSFARQLGFDASSLSQILAGKRKVSEKMLVRFLEKLGYESNPQKIISPSLNYTFIESDEFNVISDWYHYALLDLTLLKNFKSDIPYIATQLGISTAETKIAIERLLRLGMLVQKNGKLSKSKTHFTSYIPGKSSAAQREYQKQVILKALKAVDDCPVEQRSLTSMTIAVNSKKFAKAEEMIKEFRRNLCTFLEEGDQADAVYHLAVQLYPVTQINKKQRGVL